MFEVNQIVRGQVAGVFVVLGFRKVAGEDMVQVKPYNPETGKVTLDSKAPTGNYQDFIRSEVRYARLAQSFPERAKELFATAEDTAKAKYERLVKFVDFYS